jgi:hypothetical protein
VVVDFITDLQRFWQKSFKKCTTRYVWDEKSAFGKEEKLPGKANFISLKLSKSAPM